MKPNPTLTKYAFLIGEWETEVSNAEWLEKEQILKGVAKYEWLENESFILMHSEDFPEDGKPSPPKGVAVISCDDTSGQCQMLYYDERGVSRIYETSFANGTLKHWRDVPDFPQRFEGRLVRMGRISKRLGLRQRTEVSGRRILIFGILVNEVNSVPYNLVMLSGVEARHWEAQSLPFALC